MAEKTLLVIVQEFCKRAGLPVPITAAASQDDTTVQVVALLNEGIQELCDRFKGQQLTKLQQFQHANGTDYTAWDFATKTPDWKYNEPLTLWNVTSRIPVAGPITISDWQRIVTMQTAAAQYQYIIYANAFHIFPVPDPVTSITFGFYYQSKFGVIDNGQDYETYQTDNSTPKLPTYLVEADLKWRWKKEKGLPYAEDQRTCEAMLINSVGRSPHPVLNLDMDYSSGPVPGIFVQPGSWPL